MLHGLRFSVSKHFFPPLPSSTVKSSDLTAARTLSYSSLVTDKLLSVEIKGFDGVETSPLLKYDGVDAFFFSSCFTYEETISFARFFISADAQGFTYLSLRILSMDFLYSSKLLLIVSAKSLQVNFSEFL